MFLLLVPLEDGDRGGSGFSVGVLGTSWFLVLLVPTLLLILSVVDVLVLLLWLLWLESLVRVLEGPTTVHVLGLSHSHADNHSQYLQRLYSQMKIVS